MTHPLHRVLLGVRFPLATAEHTALRPIARTGAQGRCPVTVAQMETQAMQSEWEIDAGLAPHPRERVLGRALRIETFSAG